MIAHIKELVEEQAVRLVADHWLVKLAQEMGQQAEEVTKSLSLLEKESKGFCFGGNEKYAFIDQARAGLCRKDCWT